MRDHTKPYPFKEPPCCIDFEEMCITGEIDQMSNQWTMHTTNLDNYGVRYQHINYCPFCGRELIQPNQSILHKD